MRTPKILVTAVVAALTLGGVSACGSSSSGAGASSGDPVASGLIFGGPAEFKTRTDGIPGIEKTYGVTFGKYTVTDTGGPVTVGALKRGQIDAADLFTTDPSIEANDFVVLKDPKSNFAAQNIVPLINESKATAGTKQVLNAIQAKLTTTGLRDLLVKIQNDKEDPDAVAEEWLEDQDLDGTGSAAEGVTLTVGSANFPENIVLADIYADALTAQGATVTKKLNIGSREKYYPALKNGSLDLFPEYTGTVLRYLDDSSTATTPEDVYTALGKVLPANLVALDMADAQDSDAVVVTKATAEKYDLESIADLAKKVG